MYICYIINVYIETLDYNIVTYTKDKSAQDATLHKNTNKIISKIIVHGTFQDKHFMLGS